MLAPASRLGEENIHPAVARSDSAVTERLGLRPGGGPARRLIVMLWSTATATVRPAMPGLPPSCRSKTAALHRMPSVVQRQGFVD